MTVWKEAGFFMIFYLAALQHLPKELEEAAKLEGASRWYFFWRVTFPLLMPTTLFVLINAVLNSFKLVDHLFILTKGGPDNASNLLLYYIYENAFSYFDPNYASTLTVVLLALLAILALASVFPIGSKDSLQMTEQLRSSRNWSYSNGLETVGAWLLALFGSHPCSMPFGQPSILANMLSTLSYLLQLHSTILERRFLRHLFYNTV